LVYAEPKGAYWERLLACKGSLIEDFKSILVPPSCFLKSNLLKGCELSFARKGNQIFDFKEEYAFKILAGF